MKSFIETFYEEVDDNLGDPAGSKRLTSAKKLRDLHNADTKIFEALLAATGQESMLGYTEVEITLEANRYFYPLPPGFRQFLSLERWSGRTPSSTGTRVGVLRSKSHYHTDWGVEILSSNRGMRLYPGVYQEGDWLLTYLRSPGLLHYAKAGAVTENSLTAGTPGEDAGTLVKVPGYYDGVEIQIYQADQGVPQVRVVSKYVVTAQGEGVFHLRDPWVPVPTGDVYYEIVPTLPSRYDSIYALDVAILNLSRREKPEKAGALIALRRAEWMAAKSYVVSNVADRGPARVHPLKTTDFMPSAEVPYC